jgi:tRNA (guanosine-2'-O-)-methyltransferase
MSQLLLDELYKIITQSKVDLFNQIAPLRTNHVTVVLENIYQEHNASAILRSCESFGIQNLHLIEKNNKYKIQRDIARGAGRWVDMYNYNDQTNPSLPCIEKLKQQGYRIVVTSPHEKQFTPDTLPIDQPMAIVFGTEKEGVSKFIQNQADGFLTIPMCGFTESLNVSVSTAIILHTLRTRLEKSNFQWKLSEEEIIKLKIKWCEKIIPRGHLVVPEIERRLFQKD